MNKKNIDRKKKLPELLKRAEDKKNKPLQFLKRIKMAVRQAFARKPKKAILWKAGPTLNQDYSAACTGYGSVHLLNCEPNPQNYGENTAKLLWQEYKNKDFLPNDDSPDQGAISWWTVSILKRLGYIKGGVKNFDNIQETLVWLENAGPIAIGSDWRDGMDHPNGQSIIKFSGEVRGGHFYIVHGIRFINKKPFVIIQNSWGEAWGDKGHAYLPWNQFKKLIRSFPDIYGVVK